MANTDVQVDNAPQREYHPYLEHRGDDKKEQKQVLSPPIDKAVSHTQSPPYDHDTPHIQLYLSPFVLQWECHSCKLSKHRYHLIASFFVDALDSSEDYLAL